MNNDSREAFQQWFDSYKDPNVGTVETSIQFRAAWASWQAAQSRHDAEREALVRKCAEIAFSYGLAFLFEDADTKNTKLVKTAYKAASADIHDRILALLDSGSQDKPACKHEKTECVYESSDGEFERHQCLTCGERFGVEIPQ
jgi:hypothetical protein